LGSEIEIFGTEVAVPIIINILKKDKVSDPMHFQALLCLGLGLGLGVFQSCFLVCFPSGICNWKQVAPRTLQHLCGLFSTGKLSESSHDAYSSTPENSPRSRGCDDLAQKPSVDARLDATPTPKLWCRILRILCVAPGLLASVYMGAKHAALADRF
jgi:hypothetical protein